MVFSASNLEMKHHVKHVGTMRLKRGSKKIIKRHMKHTHTMKKRNRK